MRRRTAAQKRHARYLASDQWKKLRARIFAERGEECEICGEIRHLHLHHQTYARIGEEKDKDLIILCQWCHKSVHDLGKLKVTDKVRRQILRGIGGAHRKTDWCKSFIRACNNLGIQPGEFVCDETGKQWVALLTKLFAAHKITVGDVTPKQAEAQINLYLSMKPYDRIKIYNRL